MRLVQIGPPNTQRTTDFTSVVAANELPYQSIWWLQQAPTRAASVRFIPDLSIHLVFDLTGLLAVEPFLIHTGLRSTEISLPANVQLIGMQFGVWEALWLRDETRDANAIYDVDFDADWAQLIYFTLLDAHNAGLGSGALLDQLAQFRQWVDVSLRKDFHNHFVQLVAHPSTQDELAYSARHQRRLYHELTDLSPIQFRRIIRLQQTIQRIRLERCLSWDGYYDQAHLTREFKALLGMTPATFLKAYCP